MTNVTADKAKCYEEHETMKLATECGCYGLKSVPISIGVLTSSTSEGDLFLLETGVSQAKVRSLGWTSIQYDWCPYEKGKYGHTDPPEGRQCDETQGKDIYLQAEERSQEQVPPPSSQNQPCQHLDFGHLTSRNKTTTFCCLSHLVGGTLL